MEYKKLKPHLMDVSTRETELRLIWKTEYCMNPIITFDDVLVKFYEDMFDHAFYESSSRKSKDKSILSLNRLEKMLWIKDTLQDETAILKKGWDSKTKTYFKDRRVAIIKNNYVVIIRFTGMLTAKFVTAYEKNDIENIEDSPDFERTEQYFENV
jgi:hypothetical protein